MLRSLPCAGRFAFPNRPTNGSSLTLAAIQLVSLKSWLQLESLSLSPPSLPSLPLHLCSQRLGLVFRLGWSSPRAGGSPLPCLSPHWSGPCWAQKRLLDIHALNSAEQGHCEGRAWVNVFEFLTVNCFGFYIDKGKAVLPAPCPTQAGRSRLRLSLASM